MVDQIRLDEEQFHRVAKFYDRGYDGAYQSILTSGGKSIFMNYQMTVTLTDQEYQTLAAEAAKRGDSPETLLRDLIRHLPLASTTERSMTGRELAEKLYREGKLLNLATQRPLSPEEQAERERLARLFASDKPASKMVIEDRGPY